MQFDAPIPSLQTALAGAIVFTSSDSMVPILNSVHMKVQGSSVTVSATDRFAAARSTFPNLNSSEDLNLEEGILLDSKDAKFLIKWLKDLPKFHRVSCTVEITGLGDDEATPKIQVISTDGRSIGFPLVSDPEKFPKLDSIIDEVTAQAYSDPVHLGINSKYLATLDKIPATRNLGWRLEFAGGASATKPSMLKAHLWDEDLNIEGDVVVMNVRLSEASK